MTQVPRRYFERAFELFSFEVITVGVGNRKNNTLFIGARIEKLTKSENDGIFE